MNNLSERPRVKENNNVYKVYKKVSENNGQNKCEHEKEDKKIEERSEGTIGVHGNDELLILGTNRNFQAMIQEDAIRIVFSEEIKQPIVENEEIAATDASVKDGIMTGVW